MRIRDWSSDVCSSDLYDDAPRSGNQAHRRRCEDQHDAQAQEAKPPRIGQGASRLAERESLHRGDVGTAATCRKKRHRRLGLRGNHPIGRLSASRVQARSEEHTSELQSLMRRSYAVFCLKTKTNTQLHSHHKYKERKTHMLMQDK